MTAFFRVARVLFGVLPVVILAAACKHEPGVLPTAAADPGYPEHIRAILVNRCATAGCHNDASAVNSKALNLASWSKLFTGAASGSVIVPFSAENSSLLQFVNNYSDLGPIAKPAMPYNPSDPDAPINPLTREEYTALRDWIAAGAPNKSGESPFASAADTRQKIYCTMQGCDLLGVIDAETGLVMRYIQVGKVANFTESPHCVRVSPDGQYAYVCFYKSDWVQKIDTRTDAVVAELNLGTVSPNGQWNVLHLSSDGERFIVTDWLKGEAIVVKTAGNMAIERRYYNAPPSPALFKNPHGVTAVPTFDTFLITSEYGNVAYRISPNGNYLKVFTIDGSPDKIYDALTYDPHEIIFSPDRNKYFLSCQASDEVRVMDAKTDALLKVINVGTRPREMDISRNPATPYLFVTCEEDASATPKMRGSVYVIDCNTLQTVKVLEDGRFSQPHGVAVDDKNGMLYVASRNATTDGPAPHHASSCTGRNGWYSVYSLSTLQPANGKRFEVSVEPYSMDARFKNQ